MRENSGLWIALVVVGGLLLAGVAGLLGVGMLNTRLGAKAREEQRIADAERARAEAEAKLAELKAKEKGTAPVAKAPEPQATQPAANPTAAERWAKTDLRVYATDIHQAYQGNAAAADGKYKGKTLGVFGEVVKVDKLLGKYALILKAGEFESFENVMCVCEDSEQQRLEVLQAGHWVAVVGRCEGKGLPGLGIEIGLGVQLKGCVLVQAARTDAELRQLFEPKK